MSEMQAFDDRHNSSTSRQYVDGDIISGINGYDGSYSDGAYMSYKSSGRDGSYHTGAVAIVTKCNTQFRFEIWANGNYGADSNTGGLIGQNNDGTFKAIVNTLRFKFPSPEDPCSGPAD